MFLFYYVWGFSLYLVILFRNVIEYVYLKFSKNFMMFKRDFNDLGFFEKLFLVLFSKNYTFKNSIGNIYTNNNLFNYRKKKYPLIFFFHLYSMKMNYKFPLLRKLKKFFNFFKNSKKKGNTFGRVKNLFFKKHINSYDTVYLDHLIFLIIQKIFYKRYYNLCSSIYFKNFNENNLVKLNWIFYLFLNNSNKKCIIYDLSKYSDWYDFNFKKNKTNILKKIQIDKKKKKLFDKFRQDDIKYLTKIYLHYNTFFKKINFQLGKTYKNIFLLNFKFFNFKKIKLNLNSSWVNSLKVFYPIRFSETSISKHIELNNIKNYLFFYIRKNRIFNKGRYSRNRQLYRTGVYWCLWLNIILVYGLYFLFYRFTFNFGYFWWGLLVLFYSTIFSRAIKYNFYNIYKILLEFFNFIKWFGFIFRSLFTDLIDFVIFYKNIFIKNIFYYNFIKLVYNIYKIINKNKLIYFWESMRYEDTSLFRYKTIIHWFTQFYKLITY